MRISARGQEAIDRVEWRIRKRSCLLSGKVFPRLGRRRCRKRENRCLSAMSRSRVQGAETALPGREPQPRNASFGDPRPRAGTKRGVSRRRFPHRLESRAVSRPPTIAEPRPLVEERVSPLGRSPNVSLTKMRNGFGAFWNSGDIRFPTGLGSSPAFCYIRRDAKRRTGCATLFP